MTFPRTLVILFCGATLLVACSTAPTTTLTAPASPVATAAAAGASGSANTRTAPKAAMPTGSLRPHLDPKSAISTDRSVYFDFDDYTVKSRDLRTLDVHGKYLAGTPELAIRIEGNTDERGGSEYNLALGQRRAESVMRALKIYGVKDSQMEAISWGKTKPRATGHDEASLAENRRADLVYPVK